MNVEIFNLAFNWIPERNSINGMKCALIVKNFAPKTKLKTVPTL